MLHSPVDFLGRRVMLALPELTEDDQALRGHALSAAVEKIHKIALLIGVRGWMVYVPHHRIRAA